MGPPFRKWAWGRTLLHYLGWTILCSEDLLHDYCHHELFVRNTDPCSIDWSCLRGRLARFPLDYDRLFVLERKSSQGAICYPNHRVVCVQRCAREYAWSASWIRCVSPPSSPYFKQTHIPYSRCLYRCGYIVSNSWNISAYFTFLDFVGILPNFAMLTVCVSTWLRATVIH